jgi:L-alanine-DL-glutamate epimerase-like enolase superfamily enzyme
MSLAEVYQKPVAIHSWGTIISALAGLHLALASPSCAMTEYCFMDHPLNDLLSQEPVRPKDGKLLAPQFPGLGVTLNDEIIAKFRFEPGVNTMISTNEKNIDLI